MADECCCLVCVRTQEVGVVEDLGQFKALLDPGLHCIMWPLQSIVGRMSLRIQQLDVLCETKTKDNVRIGQPHGDHCSSALSIDFTTHACFFLVGISNTILLLLLNNCNTIVGLCPSRRCCSIPCPCERSVRCLLSLDGSPKPDSVLRIRCRPFYGSANGPGRGLCIEGRSR